MATKLIEWRLMLSTSQISFPIELTGQGPKAKLSIGVLHVSFDLMPKGVRNELLSDRIVN